MEAKFFILFIGCVLGQLQFLEEAEIVYEPVQEVVYEPVQEVVYEPVVEIEYQPVIETVYEPVEVHHPVSVANTSVGVKAADLTMFGETTGCGVNRDCLSCGNDRHKGCTWFGSVGCVRARKPFQCTANPFVPGEVKEQCLAFQDCKTCTTQAGCVFYKGTCTYSAGTKCLEDPLCINYPNQCPNVPLAVEARIFNGGDYNPVLPALTQPLGRPIQYQDISVMTDPYRNPLERHKRFVESRSPFQQHTAARTFGPHSRSFSSFHHPASRTRPMFSHPTVQFTPATSPHGFSPMRPSHSFGHSPMRPSHSFGHPSSRMSSHPSSRMSSRSFGHGHYRPSHGPSHSRHGRQYGWN